MPINRVPIIVLMSALIYSGHWLTAYAAFPCPEPTQQVATGIKGDINAGAQGLLKAIDGNLKGEVNKTVVNLWEKYPNADRIAIVQNLESSSCYVIRDSTLSDKEKISAWLQILQQFAGYLSPRK